MPKIKICRVCGAEFEPFQTTQRVCRLECAKKHARAVLTEREKREARKMRREARDRLKTRSEWLREAQTAVNAYIRERDKGQPCISCGRHHTGQYHAGHYLSVGSCPELRFHPANIHLQCQPCNTHLSGNQIRYRQRLIHKIGLSMVEWLEGPHKAQKWSIEDIQDIRDHYRQLRRELVGAKK